MAKLAFSKLGLKANQETTIIHIGEYDVEVKNYLPINDKMELITNVINNSIDEHNYMNPIKVDMFTELEIVEKYTNLTFTDKQKEDIEKLYDLLKGNGIILNVCNAIPTEEITELRYTIHRSVNSVYTYRNSVLGILETISTDYSNLDFNATEIQKKLADPQNMELLKSVLTKLG